MALKPFVQICLTGDLSTDYRVHKTSMSLIKLGYDVLCISRIKKGFGDTSKKDYDIKLIKTLFEKGPLFYLEYNLRLFFYLTIHRSDVVLSVDLDTLPGCWLGTRFRGRKLIFDSHEYFPEVPELQHRKFVKNIWVFLEKFLVPRVDKAYTVCESIASIYREKYNKEFNVVRNLPMKQKMESDKQVISDNRFKIVYQGAINLGRGIFETLDAMKLLDDVLLVIIGDGDESQEVKNYINNNQLSSKVTVLGKIPFTKLAAYTQSADLGLCLLENIGLNYYYSLPNRIFDFALAGVPVLASNFPEIAKVVGHYHTGLLIDNLKPENIANSIKLLKEDKETYAIMAQNAVEASKHLIWENEESVLREVFEH